MILHDHLHALGDGKGGAQLAVRCHAMCLQFARLLMPMNRFASWLLQFDLECRPFYPTGFNAFELTTLASSE